MGKTSKKEFHKKTDKFKSNRYSGWDHFKIIPFKATLFPLPVLLCTAPYL